MTLREIHEKMLAGGYNDVHGNVNTYQVLRELLTTLREMFGDD